MLVQVDCPYCGEVFDAAVETYDGSQDYIEDCPVCCRPIEFHLETGSDAELLTLTTRRDDD
jgi:Cysteine-rich CPXCG